MTNNNASFLKKLSEVVQEVLHRTESEYGVREAQTSLFHLQGKIRSGDPAAVAEARTLLGHYFYIEMSDSPFQLQEKQIFPVAVLQRFREPLMRYIDATVLPSYEEGGLVSTGDIDHGLYLAELVEKKYDPRQYPAFAALDQQITRNDLEWKVSLPKQQGELVVHPIRTLDELISFESPGNSYCILDPRRNGVQLYLYAAHAQVRLLGVWRKDAAKKEALGILPFLMMRNWNKKPKERAVERVPWLYLEAVMVDTKVLTSSVHNATGEKMSFSDALYDIITSYAALQYETPFPVVGCLRKDAGPYSASVRSFVELTTAKFSAGIFRNKVRSASLPEGQGKRLMMLPKYNGSLYLELPEDRQLLDFLNELGYRLPYLILNSQAFLEDEERNKTRLYGDWGSMQGYTKILPFLGFYHILTERLQETSGTREVGKNAILQ